MSGHPPAPVLGANGCPARHLPKGGGVPTPAPTAGREPASPPNIRNLLSQPEAVAAAVGDDYDDAYDDDAAGGDGGDGGNAGGGDNGVMSLLSMIVRRMIMVRWWHVYGVTCSRGDG